MLLPQLHLQNPLPISTSPPAPRLNLRLSRRLRHQQQRRNLSFRLVLPMHLLNPRLLRQLQKSLISRPVPHSHQHHRLRQLQRRHRMRIWTSRPAQPFHLVRSRANKMSEKLRPLQEALFCEKTLAKTGDNVLLETLRGAESVTAWQHFPQGDIYDPESGAHWYYHCHDPASDAQEHGHFHCFLRPSGKDGPVHHLIAIGVDPYGRLLRLFTVNHWVVGDSWADAQETIPLLARFDAHVGRPNYLVNRWLTAIISLYADEVTDLIHQRDVAISNQNQDLAVALKDRSLEVTSELRVNLGETSASLGLSKA